MVNHQIVVSKHFCERYIERVNSNPPLHPRDFVNTLLDTLYDKSLFTLKVKEKDTYVYVIVPFNNSYAIFIGMLATSLKAVLLNLVTVITDSEDFPSEIRSFIDELIENYYTLGDYYPNRCQKRPGNAKFYRNLREIIPYSKHNGFVKIGFRYSEILSSIC